MDLGEEFLLNQSEKKEILELRKNFLNEENKEDKSRLTQKISGRASAIIGQLRNQKLESKAVALDNDLILDARAISKTFTRGRSPFKLHQLNVQLRAGEITGVVGENGNGKTTLLRILAGELSSDSGQLNYPALTTENKGWYGVKNRLAFIPQRIDKWHGTLLDNLKFYATIHNITAEENRERIDYILFRLGLDKFRDLRWGEISSGYRLRFELAKMLLWKPKLLLLDEPLANLDINAQQLFLQDLGFFSRSAAHPMTIILTSQNLHEIERIATNIIFIRQGETIYNGQQREFANNRQKNTFEISGNFDQDLLTSCFSAHPEYTIENAGTSFIISTGTQNTIYSLTGILEQKGIELNYVRDISQSTRRLFHKDI